MRSIIFRGILSATIAFTAACSSTDSVAPASTRASADRTVAADVEGVNTVRRSIDQNVWISCANGGAGEAVRVTGDLRYDLHLTQDAAGVMHLNIKSNTSGLTAVGLTTGTFFRGLMSEHVNSRAVDELILIEPSRKEYIERGRFRIPDPSGVHSWSHPVIANGKLYVRDQGNLFCYDIKAK